jgi:hypothetical protein
MRHIFLLAAIVGGVFWMISWKIGHPTVIEKPIITQTVKEVPKFTERIVEKPVVVKKVVEKIVEKPVIKEVARAVEVPRHIEKKAERSRLRAEASYRPVIEEHGHHFVKLYDKGSTTVHRCTKCGLRRIATREE